MILDVCLVMSAVENNRAGKGTGRVWGERSPSRVCLSCHLVGGEMISFCFSHPVLPLTSLSYDYAYAVYFQNETVSLRRAEVVLGKCVFTSGTHFSLTPNSTTVCWVI